MYNAKSTVEDKAKDKVSLCLCWQCAVSGRRSSSPCIAYASTGLKTCLQLLRLALGCFLSLR